ncbi:unnamed protein product [Lepidochelys kempii]
MCCTRRHNPQPPQSAQSPASPLRTFPSSTRENGIFAPCHCRCSSFGRRWWSPEGV